METLMTPHPPTERRSPRLAYSKSCRLPRVEGIPKDARIGILRVRKRTQFDKHKNISIDEVPMMLLPKARVRTSMDILDQSRDLIIPDADYASLHLSTLHPDTDLTRLKAMSRTSFRSRSSQSHCRSDADSGFHSLKPCVTFDDLSESRSTVNFKSLEDLENISELSKNEEEKSQIPHTAEVDSVFSSVPPPTLDSSVSEAEMPEFVDSYEVTSIDNNMSRPKSKLKNNRFLNSWRSRRSRSMTPSLTHIEACHEDTCSICKVFMSDEERVQRAFGGVDKFLDWIYSRWGKSKRNELRNLPRSHYLYGRVVGRSVGFHHTSSIFRGRQPRFCNIVQQVQLHAKEERTPSPTRYPDDDPDYDDVDYLQRSIDEGRLIGSRKHSDARKMESNVLVPKRQKFRPWSAPSGSRKNHNKHGRLPIRKADSFHGKQIDMVNIPCTSEDVLESKETPSVPKQVEPTEPKTDEEHVEDKEDVAISEQTEVDMRVETPTGTEARPSSPCSTEGQTRIDVRISGLHKIRRPVKVPTIVAFDPRPPSDNEPPKTVISSDRDDTKSQDVDISTLVGETTKEDEQISSPELYIPSGADSDHDGSKQDTEPTQPPPTPEILTPKELPVVEEPKPPPKKSRACVNKKTKQPITRVKKQKENKMEEKQEEVKMPTPPQTPPLPDLPDVKDIKVDIALPDLPTFQEKEATTHKGKRKERHALVIPKNVKPKEESEELLDVPLAQKLKEFDWSGMDTQNSDDSPRKSQKAEWVTGRLALSQQSSRFELPMDMRVLETISPQDYLRQFCKITKRRQKLYSDVFRRFQKSKDRNAPFIPYNNLEKALMSVLVSTLTSEHFMEMCELTSINQETEVDVDLFSSLAALEERLLYKDFVTPETLGMPDYKKEKVECADFSALEWKFKGINVNPPVYKLLKQLAEDT